MKAINAEAFEQCTGTSLTEIPHGTARDHDQSSPSFNWRKNDANVRKEVGLGESGSPLRGEGKLPQNVLSNLICFPGDHQAIPKARLFRRYFSCEDLFRGNDSEMSTTDTDSVRNKHRHASHLLGHSHLGLVNRVVPSSFVSPKSLRSCRCLHKGSAVSVSMSF
jgi:hypothetical protein